MMNEEFSQEDREMLARALYTLVDANRRDARSHRLAGKHLATARRVLREDADRAAQLATRIYATLDFETRSEI